MKKNKTPKINPIGSCDDSAESVIGLYEMLAQAQPVLTNEDKKLLENGSLKLSSSSRYNE